MEHSKLFCQKRKKELFCQKWKRVKINVESLLNLWDTIKEIIYALLEHQKEKRGSEKQMLI